jgi:hypothetical protein
MGEISRHPVSKSARGDSDHIPALFAKVIQKNSQSPDNDLPLTKGIRSYSQSNGAASAMTCSSIKRLFGLSPDGQVSDSFRFNLPDYLFITEL